MNRRIHGFRAGVRALFLKPIAAGTLAAGTLGLCATLAMGEEPIRFPASANAQTPTMQHPLTTAKKPQTATSKVANPTLKPARVGPAVPPPVAVKSERLPDVQVSSRRNPIPNQPLSSRPTAEPILVSPPIQEDLIPRYAARPASNKQSLVEAYKAAKDAVVIEAVAPRIATIEVLPPEQTLGSETVAETFENQQVIEPTIAPVVSAAQMPRPSRRAKEGISPEHELPASLPKSPVMPSSDTEKHAAAPAQKESDLSYGNAPPAVVVAETDFEDDVEAPTQTASKLQAPAIAVVEKQLPAEVTEVAEAESEPGEAAVASASNAEAPMKSVLKTPTLKVPESSQATPVAKSETLGSKVLGAFGFKSEGESGTPARKASNPLGNFKRPRLLSENPAAKLIQK